MIKTNTIGSLIDHLVDVAYQAIVSPTQIAAGAFHTCGIVDDGGVNYQGVVATKLII